MNARLVGHVSKLSLFLHRLATGKKNTKGRKKLRGQGQEVNFSGGQCICAHIYAYQALSLALCLARKVTIPARGIKRSAREEQFRLEGADCVTQVALP